jgi:hypothetical protein
MSQHPAARFATRYVPQNEPEPPEAPEAPPAGYVWTWQDGEHRLVRLLRGRVNVSKAAANEQEQPQ